MDSKSSSSSASTDATLDHISRLHSGSVHLDDDCPSSLPRDLLTVFQAAPLAYTDSQNKLHAMGLLDFDSERRILTESLRGAVGNRIEVVFETATTDRLGDFLSKGEGQILHFSCHGHPQYLAVEDGWAHAQPLLVHDLKEWIQRGGQSLRFVFVSACHSRTAGDAFIEAGVPHVVCCQTDDQELHNVAAIEFEKAFYRNLACGKTLKEAFDLARYEVMVSPEVRAGTDPAAEVKKFVLLPEGTNHEESVFFNHLFPYSPKYRLKNPPFTAVIPPAPERFIGRELEMFRVIDALKQSRLVRVSGQAGIGTSSVVKACCHYMSDRSHIFKLDEILWLPMSHGELDNRLYSSFSLLFDSFQDDLSPSAFYFGCGGEASFVNEIMSHFRHRRSLLVFDAKNILLTSGICKLCLFLEQLLRGTHYVKVIVLHRPGDEITTEKMPCAETDIEVPALDFHSTATLFGWMCRHVWKHRHPDVCNPKDFVDLLSSSWSRDPDGRLSKRVFAMIGEGVPDRTQNIAKHMAAKKYDKLIALSQTIVDSRAALEKKSKELAEKISRAVREKKFELAQELQAGLEDLDLLREEYPHVRQLGHMAADIRGDLEIAIRSREFREAADLQNELERIERTIQIENDAAIALGVEDLVVNSDNEESKATPVEGVTRASLAKQISELERKLDDAADSFDFRKAKEINTEIAHLKQVVDLMPDTEKLVDEVSRLKQDLKQARQVREFDECECIYARLLLVEQRLQSERQAESEYGLHVDARIDPPGTYNLVEHAEGEPNPVSPTPLQMPLHGAPVVSARYTSDRPDKERERLSRPSTESTAQLNLTPPVGAFRIGGINCISEAEAEDEETPPVGAFRIGGMAEAEDEEESYRSRDDLPVAKPVSEGGSRAAEEEGARLRKIAEEGSNVPQMSILEGAHDLQVALEDVDLLEQEVLLEDAETEATAGAAARELAEDVESTVSSVTLEAPVEVVSRRDAIPRSRARPETNRQNNPQSPLQSVVQHNGNEDEQERISRMVQQALSSMAIQPQSVSPVPERKRRTNFLRKLLRRKS